jgi:AcrR family transcriptional regulator
VTSPRQLEPPLPRGRHAAPREVVWRSQRGRLLAAMADVVAESGYGAASVADVIARAGVSRKTFYEHFDNKEECFLAAYDAGVEAMLEAIGDAIREAVGTDAAGAAAEVARAGTARYLETLAANPAFARTFLVEVPAAGPAALARRAHAHERFAGLLAASARAAGGRTATPDWAFRACVGAINELVTDHVTTRDAATLPDLLDPLVAIETALLAVRP